MENHLKMCQPCSQQSLTLLLGASLIGGFYIPNNPKKKEGKMKKLLTTISVFFFLLGIAIAAEGARDDTSYYIHFNWSNSCPTDGVGGSLFISGEEVALIAARTSKGFNVYAKNNQPDAETGAPVKDHSAWPSWYLQHGWDTPDADPAYSNNSPNYLLTIDTVARRWALIYSQDPNYHTGSRGVCSLYMPMSGPTDSVIFNNDGTIDIYLREDDQNWATQWSWGIENVRLDGPRFIAHIDPNNNEGYLVPFKVTR